MNWIILDDTSLIDTLAAESYRQPVIIFKHSTRCALSSMVKSRLERSEQPSGTVFFLLDVIRYRDISNQVAATWQVDHASPQLLVIRNGACILHKSHYAIHMEAVATQLNA